MRCNACRGVLVCKYYKDFTETPFCTSCHSAGKLCRTCGRLLGPGSECKICIPRIYDGEVAGRHFHAAFQWVIEKGIRYTVPEESIHFALTRELISARHRQYDEATFGLAHILAPVGAPLRSAEINVTVLSGLPKLHLIGYSVHELGHVWLYDNNLQHLSPVEVEGFCEYLRYRYLCDVGTEEASLQMTRMRQNPNSVYGGGLRLYLDSFAHLGDRSLSSVLESMMKNR